MSDPGDDRLRSAWARHTEQTIDVDPTKAEANVRRRQAAITRRDRIVYLSASIIGPSMLAVSWFRPDLRLASVPGVFIVGGHAFWHYLDRDGTLEVGVDRSIDLSHAAFTEGGNNFVWPDAGTRIHSFNYCPQRAT